MLDARLFQALVQDAERFELGGAMLGDHPLVGHQQRFELVGRNLGRIEHTFDNTLPVRQKTGLRKS